MKKLPLAIAAVLLTGASLACRGALASYIPVDTLIIAESKDGDLNSRDLPNDIDKRPQILPRPIQAGNGPGKPGFTGPGERNMFNDFIYAALGPMGKADIAQSLHSIGSTLKPFLDSQGAYEASSAPREFPQVFEYETRTIQPEFSYFGVLSTTAVDAKTVSREPVTRNVDAIPLDRVNAQPNSIMQGVLQMVDSFLKGLARMFA